MCLRTEQAIGGRARTVDQELHFLGAREMVWPVKSLPQQCEELSLIPGTQVKRQAWQFYSSTAGEVETGGSLELAGQLS